MIQEQKMKHKANRKVSTWQNMRKTEIAKNKASIILIGLNAERLRDFKLKWM